MSTHPGRVLVVDDNENNRDILARRLTRSGYTVGVADNASGLVERIRSEAIELVHQAGGLAVLAHPGLARSEEAIFPLIEMGLDGLECFHTKHSPAMSEYYVGVAEQHGLLITGGSDCHGMNKGKPLIGTIKLPYEYVRLLKERLPEGHQAK